MTSREAPGRFGFVGGLDVAVGENRFAVVPSFRVVNSPFGLQYDTYNRWRWSVRTGVLLKVRLSEASVTNRNDPKRP